MNGEHSSLVSLILSILTIINFLAMSLGGIILSMVRGQIKTNSEKIEKCQDRLGTLAEKYVTKDDLNSTEKRIKEDIQELKGLITNGKGQRRTRKRS